MTQDTQIVLPFARLCGKTLQADFDGGTLSSDGGVLFLRETEAQVGIIRRFVEALDDRQVAAASGKREDARDSGGGDLGSENACHGWSLPNGQRPAA